MSIESWPQKFKPENESLRIESISNFLVQQGLPELLAKQIKKNEIEQGNIDTLVADLNKATRGFEDNKQLISQAVGHALVRLDKSKIMGMVRNGWDALPAFLQKSLVGQNAIGKGFERATTGLPFLAGMRLPSEMIKSAVQMGLLDVKELENSAVKISLAKIAELNNLKNISQVIPGSKIIDPLLLSAEKLLQIHEGLVAEIKKKLEASRQEQITQAI